MNKLIVTFLGVGLVRFAPGTLASLATLPVAVAAYAIGGIGGYAALTALALIAGFAMVPDAVRNSGSSDPSEIVIDEVAGQLIALFPLPLGLWLRGSDVAILPWPGILAAFILFRVFDILKPWPVGYLDNLPFPAAVMLDDIAAGLLSAVLLVALAYIGHGIIR